MGQATLIKLSDEERQTLHSWVNSHTTQQRHVFRAKIILLADKGKQTKQIAKDLGSNAPTISKWRTRFARDRITGLVDAPRSGQPSKYGKETEKRILAILDNLNTHKPKNDRWLAMHKNVHFHYTPTHASWLNQIETWFSILTRSAIKGASFTSPQQVREAIDAFAEAYNEDATPFEWTKTTVRPKGLKRHYADLCN